MNTDVTEGVVSRPELVPMGTSTGRSRQSVVVIVRRPGNVQVFSSPNNVVCLVAGSAMPGLLNVVEVRSQMPSLAWGQEMSPLAQNLVRECQVFGGNRRW